VGGCHCGAVRFEVEADTKQAGRCNCSVCTKIAATGGIVKPAAFKLLTSEDGLGVYVWGAQISKRYFCKTCGVHLYGIGHLAELGGDFLSVNLNALDDIDPNLLPVTHWDGRHNNWMAGMRDQPWPILGAQ
jgi:hypothetical protein